MKIILILATLSFGSCYTPSSPAEEPVPATCYRNSSGQIVCPEM